MADKFFEDKEENQEPEKIKLGETEFTQEELQELVGAGKKLREIETKQGQPVDEILKSWGKRGERLGEWKKVTGAKKPDEFLKKVEEEKSKTPEDLDREQIKQKVLQEAREFGLLTRDELSKAGFMTKEDFEKIRKAEKTLSQVKKTIRSNSKKGYPETTPEKLLEFMADPNNPADPKVAYEVMFKDEIRQKDMEKLQSIKGKPIYTDKGSTAGSKEFSPEKPKDLEGLRKAMEVHMAQR